MMPTRKDFSDITKAALSATRTAASRARTAQEVQDAAFEALLVEHIARGYPLSWRMERVYRLTAEGFATGVFRQELQRRQAN